MFDVMNWPIVVLAFAATVLFRQQGDSWPVTVAKLVGLTGLFLAVVVILGVVIARLW